jgi:hypothetical protein
VAARSAIPRIDHSTSTRCETVSESADPTTLTAIAVTRSGCRIFGRGTIRGPVAAAVRVSPGASWHTDHEGVTTSVPAGVGRWPGYADDIVPIYRPPPLLPACADVSDAGHFRAFAVRCATGRATRRSGGVTATVARRGRGRSGGRRRTGAGRLGRRRGRGDTCCFPAPCGSLFRTIAMSSSYAVRHSVQGPALVLVH